MSFSVFQASHDWAKGGGLDVWAEKETTSTNVIAKENAFLEKEALVLYVTDHQATGRGRGHHTWSADSRGHYLLSSWSFLLRDPAQPVLAPALGLSLFKAAQSTWLGLPWSLKAPNDLFLADKKVAGLLIESVQEGTRQRLIVGLGVNVSHHPGIDRSGALTDLIPESEVTLAIWWQFLDRLLLEFTSTLLLTGQNLIENQRRGLAYALNQFPDKKDSYKSVLPDGSLELKDGKKILWSSL